MTLTGARPFGARLLVLCLPDGRLAVPRKGHELGVRAPLFVPVEPGEVARECVADIGVFMHGHVMLLFIFSGLMLLYGVNGTLRGKYTPIVAGCLGVLSLCMLGAIFFVCGWKWGIVLFLVGPFLIALGKEMIEIFALVAALFSYLATCWPKRHGDKSRDMNLSTECGAQQESVSSEEEYRTESERLGDLLEKAAEAPDGDGSNLTEDEQLEIAELWSSEGMEDEIGPCPISPPKRG